MTLAKRIDKLGAVNLMLSASGDGKVNTLVDDGINDTDVAQQILDEVIIDVLSLGWDFNRVKKTLLPDDNDKIAISQNYLRVDGSGYDYRRRFGVRDNFLYDLDKDQDTFTEKSVDLEVIQNLSFDDIPVAVQMYIARAAATIYQAQTHADPDVDLILRFEEQRAWERARKYNSKTGDRSFIRDSRSTAKLISSRRQHVGERYNPPHPI